MKYCPFCGAGLRDEMRFCPVCGKEYVAPVQRDPENQVSQSTITSNRKPENTSTVFPTQKQSGLKRKLPVILICFISILIVLVISFLPSIKSFSKSTSAIQEASQSVVMLFCYDPFGNLQATGSGFIAYNDSTVITNYHVIDGAAEVKLSTENDLTIGIDTVISYDVEKDIAILSTSEPTGLEVLPLGSSAKEEKGSTVVAIGSPLGKKNTISTGILSGRFYDSTAGTDLLQFSAPISSGSSGGALFNNRGEIIGITSATFIEGQNLNIAVPTELLEEVYNNRKKPLTLEICFKRVHGYDAGNCYLNSEFVEFSDLISNPQKYDGTKITTVAYFLSDIENQGDLHAFADEISSLNGVHWSKNSINTIVCSTSDNLEVENGYALVSGEFSVGTYYSRLPNVSLTEWTTYSKEEKEEYCRRNGISTHMEGRLGLQYCRIP